MNWDFTELDKAVKSWRRNNPKIKTSNTKLNTGWMLAIYADIEDQDAFYNHEDLDDYVKWAAAQLKNWSDVYKTGYNTWIFVHERDIEKFNTLFALYKSSK